MLSGKYRGSDIGSGTNIWSMSEDLRAGKITLEEFHEAESCMHRSHGHCMTMGTASTMASMVEALGVGMPGNAAIPAVDARRNVLARMAGRRIVEMVKEDLDALEDPHARGVRERDPRQCRDRRLDQRRHPPDRARAAASASSSTLDDWDRLGRGVHYAGQPHALGQVPDGGLLLRRRPAGGAARAGRERPAAQERAHRQRQDHLGEQQGRAVLEPRRDHAVRETVQEEHRHRRAARQPLPRRRDHQALGGDAEAA